MAVSSVSDTTVTPVAGTPSKVTPVAPVKPVPVRVTGVPPLSGPWPGAIAAATGATAR
jgi:hypothetical protein